MTVHATTLNPPSRRLGRSAGAVALGFLAVFVLSLGTDQVLHVLKVYPPWGEAMSDPRLNALALAYRCVYGVVGSYIMARFAPYAPMRHVWIGAGIGFMLSAAGAIAAIQMKLGPAWYPIALALSAWPTAWLGGTLACRARSRSVARTENPSTIIGARGGLVALFACAAAWSA